MAAENIVEGWTSPINQQLMSDNVPFDLTGMTVVFQLFDLYGAPIPFTGTYSVTTANLGKVQFQPAANDLLASKSPYQVRWKVTDGVGKVSFFPRNQTDQWTVRKP